MLFGIIDYSAEIFLKCCRRSVGWKVDIFHHRHPDPPEFPFARSVIPDIYRPGVKYSGLTGGFAVFTGDNIGVKRKKYSGEQRKKSGYFFHLFSTEVCR